VLLDLSSTFDTVDQDILLSVLAKRFGINGVALRWFQSYFRDRSQTFVVNGKSPTTHHVNCSVPRGSCLGPVEFITYTESVISVLGRHRINHRLFADDKQAYASTRLDGVDDVRGRLRDCTTDIINWCASYRLQLNESKTELTWFGKRSRLNKLVDMDQTVTVGASVIQPAAVIRDLSVLLDQELIMTQHIARVTSSCFYQLRRLRQIRRPIGQELVAQLVHLFVLSRLDYRNSILAGLPKSAIMPLQRVQNAAARLILDLRMNEHVTPALRQLHWLPIDR
jgi:Reverse transcriptase (RNA-dependent DNA polymerase)